MPSVLCLSRETGEPRRFIVSREVTLASRETISAARLLARLPGDRQRRVNAVLAEAQVGAKAAELLEQEAHRRRFRDVRVSFRLPGRAVPLVDHLVSLRVEMVWCSVGADRHEPQEP